MQNNYPQSLNILFKKYHYNSDILNNIQKHAQKIINLNNIILNLLPLSLKKECRVANYRKFILVLEISNANKKIQLHYELPLLFSKLRNSTLPSLSKIKIIINPSLSSKKLQKI
ncbi:MAG: DciA family protein [Arsenophonus sp.]|nr:MAG: DciA family protein [Arsenophonus sp.]